MNQTAVCRARCQRLAAMAELAPIADLYEERSGVGVTYFELTAALAFAWFADRSVEAAVVG